MTDISIYDEEGTLVDNIYIDDDILPPINDRVSKGKQYWYKGAGAYYHSHMIPAKMFHSDVYDFIKKSDVFYMGYEVSKKAFQRKFGIFQEQYQPMFSDFIGGCGVKELSIIENSLFFERSSANIIDSVKYDKLNNQYYFKVNYKCNRIKYLDDPHPEELRDLLDYMIAFNWNFIWDKRSITDISSHGLISDVGEIFVSKTVDNKLGSVYSVLYGLGKHNQAEYLNLLRLYDLTHNDEKSYILNSVAILDKNKVDVAELKEMTYEDILLKYLVSGRNCGHCSYVDVGDNIKDHYIKAIKNKFKMV